VFVNVRLDEGCLVETGPCHLSTHMGILSTLSRYAIVDLREDELKFHPYMEENHLDQCIALRKAYRSLKSDEVLGEPDIRCAPGLPPHREVDPGKPEVCSIGALQNLSKVMQEQHRLATARIASNVGRDDIWTTRLEPVAARSESVVVFDKYEGDWFAKHLAKNPEAKEIGFAWLLDKLGNMPGISTERRFKVTLVTMEPESKWSTNGTTDGFAHDLRVWAGVYPPIVSERLGLEVHTWPRLPKKHPMIGRFHDRYLVFKGGSLPGKALFSLGRGVSAFHRDMVDDGTETDMTYNMICRTVEIAMAAQHGVPEHAAESLTDDERQNGALVQTAILTLQSNTPGLYTKIFP